MEWLTQNLDAYRIVAEILTSMRVAVRERLEKAHGRSWYREGVPRTVLDDLIASKEREQAIDWYDSEYQEIIDYAVFVDLLQIVEHDPELFAPLMSLAPSPSLLHARFMELEVMRSKVGRARPLSENELAYLTKFHQRVRKALEEIESADLPERSPAGDEAPASDPDSDSGNDDDITIEVESPDITDLPDRPEHRVMAAADRDAPSATPSGSDRVAPSRPPPVPSSTGVDDAGPGRESDDTRVADSEPVDEGTQQLAVALEKGDDRAVLRALYQEVTTLAEGLFANGEPVRPTIWAQVAESGWYQSSHGRLGLGPLPDFYHVLAEAREQIDTGAGKDQLQEFLKEKNFAKLLISLRDMFQKNKI